MQSIKAETQLKQLVEVDPTGIPQRMSAYGILAKEDRVLVVKTRSGNWEFPGGGCEDGETLIQALQRELKEEVTIDATVGRMVYMRESFYHTSSGKTYHSLQFFFSITTSDTPRAGDVIEATYMPIADLTKENTNRSAYLAIKNVTSDTTAYKLWDEA